MKTVLGLLLMCSLSAFCATPNHTASTIRVGMTPAQVHAVFGAPRSYFMQNEHFSHYPRIVVGRVLDCYERRIHGRLYEVRIMYDLDTNGSRIHPAQRVIEVFFVSDQLEPARELLADFIEALVACNAGCDVLQKKGNMGDGSDDELVVRQSEVVFNQQIEIELKHYDVENTFIMPVRDLGDISSFAELQDHIPLASYGEETRKIGRWPETKAQSQAVQTVKAHAKS
jgi:hypothetical protein